MRFVQSFTERTRREAVETWDLHLSEPPLLHPRLMCPECLSRVLSADCRFPGPAGRAIPLGRIATVKRHLPPEGNVWTGSPFARQPPLVCRSCAAFLSSIRGTSRESGRGVVHSVVRYNAQACGCN